MFNNDSYTGVDIHKSGHNHCDSIIDVFYDGKRLPFHDNIFDSIICSEVFEHLFKIEEILLELNRVLKKKGTFLITCPFVWPLHEIPYDYARYTPYALEYLLNNSGFKIIKKLKTTNFIETIFQIFIIYITDLMYIKIGRYKGKINGLINLIFISPLTFLGLILGYLMPKNFSVYHNNVIISKKN